MNPGDAVAASVAEGASASAALDVHVPSLPKIMYLFSGKCGRAGGFDAEVRKLGLDVELIDVEICETHDLCDDVVFEKLRSRLLAGEFAAVLMSPPCSTFSRARSRANWSGGPAPLRGSEGPALYGLPGLQPDGG